MIDKCCNKCGQTKPLPSFEQSKLQADGYCGWCKACQQKYGLARYFMKEKKKKIRKTYKNREPDANTANENKACTRCGFLFEASLKYFGLNMARKDHLSTRCKKCIDIVRRKKARKNKTYTQRHKKAYDGVGKLLT